jgi:aminopeptidase-like protein
MPRSTARWPTFCAARARTTRSRNSAPWGYDERQYCSPGFDFPVGCLVRTPHGRFPEYHTSADDLDFVRPEALADSLAKCAGLFEILEHNRVYLNTNPNCEPQFEERGLYDAIGGRADRENAQMAMLWVLNQSDGTNDLLEIAERSSMPFEPSRRWPRSCVSTGSWSSLRVSSERRGPGAAGLD